MVTLVNRAKMSTATTGTGTITLGSAESGYQSFADAGVADGDVVRYVIEDGNAWEIGTGTYTASGTTLSRTVLESSNADAALNLTGSAVVYVSATAEDIPSLQLYAENPSTPTAPTATGTNAASIGNGADATGNNSFAIGTSTTASGGGSLAIGYYATATTGIAQAIGATSGGFGSQAVAGGATALGGAYASGTDSLAAAIANNTSSYGATGANSVAIGKLAKASGTASAAIGESTQATASNSISIGYLNQSTAQGAVSLGYNVQATGVQSTAIGVTTRNSINGTLKFAGGKHSVDGDAQTGIYPLLAETTDATPTVAVTYHNNSATPSTNNQIILPNNSAYAFHGTIVARQQASQGTACAAWKIEGLIRREGSAGTTVLVNSATTVIDNTPSWGMSLSADTTNGGLKIEFTGAAATNIRVVATIHTSEVTY